jgi:hypothetical protein
MSGTDDLELQRLLNQAIARVADERLAPVAQGFARGIVDVVVGSTAWVRKGTAADPPTPGFDVLPHLDVQVGDLVWYYELGNDRLIVGNLSRGGITLPAASPQVINSGTIQTAALSGPGVATIGVKVETGLTYVPMVLVYHSKGDGVWRQAPNLVSNEAGQILENYRFSVTVADTNKTRFVFATYSSRPEGIPAQTYRWVIFDRAIG